MNRVNLLKMLYSKVLVTFAGVILDELSMDKRDSNHFISRRLVCRYIAIVLYNWTDSSLVTVGYQLHLLSLRAHGTIA